MSSLVNKTEAYVSDLLSNRISEAHTFHNLDHTREVVDNVIEIGQNSGLSDEDLELIVLAAWFHDVGHVKAYEGHEEESIKLADKFLTQHEYEPDKIDIIKKIILSTAPDEQPETLLEKIMCDADVLHIGKKGSLKKGRQLRQEWEKLLDRSYTDSEWLQFDLAFYQNSKFLTNYARQNYDTGRLKNIAKLEKKLVKRQTAEKAPLDKTVKKIIKKRVPERGVETVFRVTSRNHIRLSAIADNKANTLISINAIIISIIISLLADQLQVNPHLVIPTVLMLATSVITVVLAILSTKPKVTEGKINRDTIEQREGNLLFFGNFHSMSFDDYEWAMNRMMHDREYLYHNLIQDVYYLGLVLERKYRFLRISFTIFMFGLVISVLAFVTAFVLN